MPDWVRPLLDNVQFLLEKLLSWPVITLAALLVYRRQLSALLNRIEEFGIGKASLKVSAATTTQSETKTLSFGLSFEDERLRTVKNIGLPVVVQRTEQAIRTDLGKMVNYELDPQAAVDLLVRHLAVTQLWLGAERVYRTIFGSQIELLQRLNLAPRSRANLVGVYEHASGLYSALYTAYSFDQWVDYMLLNGLIATQDRQSFTITDVGIEFLKWMTEQRVPQNKLF